jgi:hypothetical protein
MQADAIRARQQFPFIGPITSFHLAKNLGLPVAKSDRHLVRLANAVGFEDVQSMCRNISSFTGDPVPVVDIVLWRFSAIGAYRRLSLLGQHSDKRCQGSAANTST